MAAQGRVLVAARVAGYRAHRIGRQRGSGCLAPAGLSCRVVGQPGGRSLRAVVERSGCIIGHATSRVVPYLITRSLAVDMAARSAELGGAGLVVEAWKTSAGRPMIVAWLPFPGALTNGEGRVCYVDNGYPPVMARKRRRTSGAVVRLRSGRIAGL